MQAEFAGSFGQAFTDMYGDFEGTLQDVLAMELNNNYRRAIFVATLNAVLRSIGMIEGSVHCKDKGPAECGLDLLEFLEGYGGRGSHWLDFSRFTHGAVLRGVNSGYWIGTRRISERRSSVLWCWMVVRMRSGGYDGGLNTYYYVSTPLLRIYRTSVTQLYKNNNPPK